MFCRAGVLALRRKNILTNCRKIGGSQGTRPSRLICIYTQTQQQSK
jgi:hypothetical protein